MPELPEVEVLARHLNRVLPGRIVRDVRVFLPKLIRPATPASLRRALRGAQFNRIRRRGKYLVLELTCAGRDRTPLHLLGHLGMTGRMYLLSGGQPPPRHAAVSLRLDRGQFVFEDMRRFGRLTTDLSALQRLGPEPLARTWTATCLAAALRKSRQAIKVRLLDQRVVAGIGNLYASELLHRARIHPGTPSNQLNPGQVRRVHRAVRTVLAQAIRFGSTVPLNWSGQNGTERLFYYGRIAGTEALYTERLRVYDRAGQPCPRCAALVRRFVQTGRSTYYCPECQAG